MACVIFVIPMTHLTIIFLNAINHECNHNYIQSNHNRNQLQVVSFFM